MKQDDLPENQRDERNEVSRVDVGNGENITAFVVPAVKLRAARFLRKRLGTLICVEEDKPRVKNSLGLVVPKTCGHGTGNGNRLRH